jgi:hypothetical protein
MSHPGQRRKQVCCSTALSLGVCVISRGKAKLHIRYCEALSRGVAGSFNGGPGGFQLLCVHISRVEV